MEVLNRANVPFLVGGAYALGVYTKISRDTKDLDLFLRPADVDPALKAFDRAGYRTEKTFPHWIAKAKQDEYLIDLIFRAGNGLCEVDDSWFRRACEQEVLGVREKLCPVEEFVWMKSFIMERERFDGADVLHLIQSRATKLDWAHLIDLFGEDWRVLFAHLILFGYVYPSERHLIPADVMDDLLARASGDKNQRQLERLCRGTLLSRRQYLIDVEQRGFRDARSDQRVQMSCDDIKRWTDAIAR